MQLDQNTGRLVDRVGPRLPTRLGIGIMLITMIALSLLAGGSITTMSILAGLLGAGFALLNTPIAAIVLAGVLASALSINTMMFFIGGSIGAALFSAIVNTNADTLTALNPFYSGLAINYSDAFSVLALAAFIAVFLVASLPTKQMVDTEKSKKALPDNWTPNCEVPWSEEL
ncbi:MAG: MFS transporter [Arenicella sp.]|nr:MFS transporter [Arenicella sp.]